MYPIIIIIMMFNAYIKQLIWGATPSRLHRCIGEHVVWPSVTIVTCQSNPDRSQRDSFLLSATL